MQRLDKLLLERYPDFSRSRIEGLVKAGFVTVNGATAEKAGMKVSESDEIEVEIPPPVPAVPEPEDIPLDVVFEDDDMLVVNKAPGMVVHPAPGHFTGTLVNALLHHCPNLAGIGGVARPGIVHRLDQDTSGLIVVAKTQAAMDGLTKAFASHKNIEKTYLAVCHGRPRLDSGRIENLIGRHPVDRKRMAIVEKNGKLAITNWKVARCLGGEVAKCLGGEVAKCIGGEVAKCLGGEVAKCLGGEVAKWRSGEVAKCASAPSHSATQPLSTPSHSATQPLSHSATQPLSTPSHSATQPLSTPSHSATHPLSHSATQPLSYPATHPLSHPVTCIECRIETGRTHQIRVHMASLGCPVIGDKVYGKGALDRRLDPVPARQMLHAWKLKLWHPVRSEQLSFEAPLPPDMRPYCSFPA